MPSTRHPVSSATSDAPGCTVSVTAPADLARLVVSVADLHRALGFYHHLLGLPATSTDGLAFLRAGPGIEVYLHERPSEPSDRSVAAAFHVAGLDERVATWAAQGGVVVDEPDDQPWGERMAVVRDPDGHLVCLIDADPAVTP